MKFIYLDLNKWIDLSRSYHYPNRDNSYSEIASILEKSVERGEVSFALSSMHLIEAFKNFNKARRTRLAKAMSTFSKGCTINPGYKIVLQELDICIHSFFNNKITKFNKMINPFGKGILNAFEYQDLLESELVTINSVLVKKLSNYINREDNFETQLFDYFEASAKGDILGFMKEESATAEKRERKRIEASKLGKEQIKVAYINEIIDDLHYDISVILKRYGSSIDDFKKQNIQDILEFFSTVPSLNTDIELSVERDKHTDRPIDSNDLVDLAFLSIAIPYYDAVVTEKFWVDLAKRKKFDSKYSTLICSDLNDLNELI